MPEKKHLEFKEYHFATQFYASLPVQYPILNVHLPVYLLPVRLLVHLLDSSPEF